MKKTEIPESFSELCRNRFSGEECAFLKDAYLFAACVHEDQKRDSGEPYIIHPVAVAQILAETGADCETVAAGLLHDTVEDGRDISVQMIADRFGESVAFLVDSVTKIPQKDEKTGLSLTRPEATAKSREKLLRAAEKDKRAVAVKPADRLRNMRAISFCSEKKDS